MSINKPWIENHQVATTRRDPQPITSVPLGSDPCTGPVHICGPFRSH
jgi:hypothetical protein